MEGAVVVLARWASDSSMGYKDANDVNWGQPNPFVTCNRTSLSTHLIPTFRMMCLW